MRWSGRMVARARAAVLRPGIPCALCGFPIVDVRDAHVEHTIPRADGGPDTYANLRPSHAACNLRKGRGTVPPAAPPSRIAMPIAYVNVTADDWVMAEPEPDA